MVKPRLTAIALAAVLAVGATACGGTTKKSSSGDDKAAATSAGKANPNAPLKKNLKIAFLPKQINNPYETIVDKAGIAAGDGVRRHRRRSARPTPPRRRRSATSTR